jgi:hypothetical protein
MGLKDKSVLGTSRAPATGKAKDKKKKKKKLPLAEAFKPKKVTGRRSLRG